MTIEEASQKLQELTEAAKESNIDINVPTGQAMLKAIKSLEAWDEARKDIKAEATIIMETAYITDKWNSGRLYAFGEILGIIDKHLSEVSE